MAGPLQALMLLSQQKVYARVTVATQARILLVRQRLS